MHIHQSSTNRTDFPLFSFFIIPAPDGDPYMLDNKTKSHDIPMMIIIYTPSGRIYKPKIAIYL